MPFVQIYLAEGKPMSYIQALGDAIHASLVKTWGIPQDDRFHLIHEKKPEHMGMNPQMWEMERSDDLIILHITSSPRSREMKLEFYSHLAKLLNKEIGLRPDDLFISIISNEREDWSFGKGEAQLLA